MKMTRPTDSQRYWFLLSLLIVTRAQKGKTFPIKLNFASYTFLLAAGAGMKMKPRFVDEMNNITVEVGQDATFICTVSEIHVRSSLIAFNSYIFLVQGIQGWLGEC